MSVNQNCIHSYRNLHFVFALFGIRIKNVKKNATFAMYFWTDRMQSVTAHEHKTLQLTEQHGAG